MGLAKRHPLNQHRRVPFTPYSVSKRLHSHSFFSLAIYFFFLCHSLQITCHCLPDHVHTTPITILYPSLACNFDRITNFNLSTALNMFSKSAFVLAFFTISKFATAAPPACLLAAIK